MKLLFIILVIYIFYRLSSGFLKQSKKAKRDLNPDAAKRLVALLAKVAKSDGAVSASEAQVISETITAFAREYGISRESLKAIYEAEKLRLDNARSIAMQYRFDFGLSKQEAINVLVFLLNLAYIDGEFSEGEKRILGEISSGLGISEWDKNTIFTRFETEFNARFKNAKSSLSPYATLGLDDGASFEEVRRRYKELVRQNHPDVLMGRGASQELISEATKRLQEINEAYERIKKQQERF